MIKIKKIIVNSESICSKFKKIGFLEKLFYEDNHFSRIVIMYYKKLILLIINNVLHGRALPVYGDGMNVRDWLYVEDHCKGIDIVLEKGRLGEVYNIGGFNEETNINIVKLIIDIISRIMTNEPEYRNILKTDLENTNYSLITYVQDRLGHDARYAIDSSKIVKELGWYPETPFVIGIEKTIRWYLDNQEWLENVTSGDYQKYYEEMYKR